MSQLSFYRGAGLPRVWIYITGTLLLVLSNVTTLKAQNGYDMADAIYVGSFSPCGGEQFSDSKSTHYYNNNFGSWGPDVWYKVVVHGYTDLRVSTCTNSFDTYLHLVDANGNEMASNDDSNCGQGSYLEYSALGDGTYYIVVDGTGTNYSGDVLVSVWSASTGAFAYPGASFSNPINAGTFSGQGSYTNIQDISNLCLSNVSDYPGKDVFYKFTLATQATVRMAHCGSGFDTYMKLLDENGNFWTSNDDNAELVCPGSEAYIQITLQPGTYYVVSDAKYNISGNLVTSIDVGIADCPQLRGFPSADQNYIITHVPRVPITDPTYLLGKTVCEVNQTIEYFDGLGRPLQTVQTKASPNTANDLVTVKDYDQFGRETKQYLPYAASGTNASFRSNALQPNLGLSEFYNSPPSGVTQILNYPYAETKFDNSPINRVLEQAAPGADFSLLSGHTVKTAYETNATGEVPLWEVTSTGAATTSNYLAGELYKTITKDENWISGKSGTVEEFKDKEDRIILKRIWETESKALSTYYVYNDKGNLSYVIPPGYTAATLTETYAGSNTSTFDQFIYAYHYDERNRLVEKKIPGKGWEYMVYDKLDQLVATQDAVMRPTGKWIFTKYDALGRVILTGIYTDSGSRATVQGVANNVNITACFETRTDSTYTSVAFPTSFTSTLTTNYYDDYTFNTNVNYNFATAHVYGLQKSQNTTGLLTGSLVNILGGSVYLKTVNYYDDDARLIQAFEQNHLGGIDRVDNQYSFVGELTNTTRSHVSTYTNVTIANRYQYDHMGRKLRTYQKTGSGTGNPEILLSELVYNEVGQLKDKRLHSLSGSSNFSPVNLTLGAANIVNSGQTFNSRATNSITLLPGFEAKEGSTFTAKIESGMLQESHYTYNSRSWLKTLSAGQFEMELKYNDAINGMAAQYNGNIANQVYTNGTANTFNYSYDKLNRLTNGTAIGMSEVIEYDDMGNIKKMNRDGAGVGTYAYNGNRLYQITGAPLATAAYDYDENGNAKVDGRNGKTITYNLLNLPQTITGGLTYTYDAAGRKLKKQSGANITDYIGGIQYYNNNIEFIQTEEGIARRSGNNYSYEYNLDDHLGNVRTGFYRNPTTQALEVIQRNNYYPFGLKASSLVGTNKYLYNGKELQDELGQYDYGARHYDPVIGRFTTVDPLAEVSRKYSPYVYTYNNPIRFIDPDGMWTTDGKGNSFTDDPDDIAAFIQQARGQQQDNEEKHPLQSASDGYGTLIKRRYSATVRNSRQSAKSMFDKIRGDFSSFVEGQSYFENITRSGAMQEGDEISIVGGPGYGVSKATAEHASVASQYVDGDGNLHTGLIKTGVTVVDITENKNSYSMTFQTWQGHVEAGTITFNVMQNSNGTVSLNISSNARNSGWFTNGVYNYLGGRQGQTEHWNTFLNNFVKFTGGTVVQKTVK
jgi:RHS repeat-associated protein